MAIDNILVDNTRFSFCTVLPLDNVLSDHDACSVHCSQHIYHIDQDCDTHTHTHIQNKINHKRHKYTFSELLCNETWVSFT
jgi:hypothetical protein